MKFRCAQQQLVATLTVLVISTIGCAGPKAELPPQMTQDLTTLRDQLVQAKAQIQTTGNAARDLTTRPQMQLQPQIDRLVSSIKSLEDLATSGRKQYQSAGQNAQAYFANWDQQMNEMSDSIKMQGEERLRKSQASFDELKKRANSLKEEFRPFMAQLSEISKYLQTDTTSEGVKIVTPQIKSALNREDNIMKRVDDVIEQIDAIRGGK